MAVSVNVDYDRGTVIAYSPVAAEPQMKVGDSGIFSDYDVLPAEIVDCLSGADFVEIADPLSFPFDDTNTEFWATPLRVHLPNLALVDCVNLLDSVLLRRLTVQDQLVVPAGMEAELQLRYGFPSSMFVAAAHKAALSTVDEKARLLPLDKAVKKAFDRFLGPGEPRKTEIHGFGVAKLLPAVWSGLARIVEYDDQKRLQLESEYGLGVLPPNIHRATDSLESAVVVGLDLLGLGDDHSVRRAITTLYETTHSSGRMILIEDLSGPFRPDDLVDLLLDVTTHRITLENLEILTLPGQAVSTTAVFELNKLGRSI